MSYLALTLILKNHSVHEELIRREFVQNDRESHTVKIILKIFGFLVGIWLAVIGLLVFGFPGFVVVILLLAIVSAILTTSRESAKQTAILRRMEQGRSRSRRRDRDNKSDEAERYECPDCAELVKARARKCRFCGARLNPDDYVEEVDDTPPPRKSRSRGARDRALGDPEPRSKSDRKPQCRRRRLGKTLKNKKRW